MGKTILLVEDEAIIAMAEKDDLERYGYRVMTAYSGEKAVEMARENSELDLILMDINLGKGMDGTEAAREIIQQRNIPIVFLSSHTEPEVVEKTEKITSYGYVVKNSGMTVLDTSIKMAFRLHRLNMSLNDEKEYLRTTFNSIGDAVMATDANGKITRMNPIAEKLTGWSFEQASGRPMEEVFVIQNASTGEKVKNPVETVLERGSVVGLANHTVLLSKDGNRYQIADTASPIANMEGEMIGVVLVFKDVTQDYKIQQELRISEERFSKAFHSGPTAIALTRAADGKIVEVNEQWCELFGYTREEAVGNSSIGLGIADPEIRKKFVADLSLTGSIRNLETTKYTKTGTPLHVLISLEKLNIDNEPHILKTIIDITARKKIEEALLESERNAKASAEELEKFFNLIPTMVCIASAEDGRFKKVNKAWTDTLGFSEQELLSRPLQEFIHPDDVDATFEEVDKQLAGGATAKFVNRYRTKNGEYRYFEWVATPAESNILFAAARDITEGKSAQEEKETVVEFLSLVNDCTSSDELIRSATGFFKRKTAFDAVGIRLNRGYDYPYYETRGFPDEFVNMENNLCPYDRKGRPILDDFGDPLLECMCGNVIRGRFDPEKPFFTERGSFWTNSTTELLSSTSAVDRQSETRDRCNGAGYESVALFPLMTGKKGLGLIQLNDKRKGRFTPETIALWEQLAGYLSIAVSKFLAEETKDTE